MAFLTKGATILSSTGGFDEVAFISLTESPDTFLDFEDPDYASVTFYTFTSGALGNVTPVVCPGSTYAVRIELEGDGIEAMFLGNPVSTTKGVVFPLVPSSSAASMARFVPTKGTTITNAATFSGTVASFTSSDLVLYVNDNWAEGGLSAPMPSVISDCAVCGCQAGQICQSGFCSGTVSQICKDSNICGEQNGRCPGTCPSSKSVCTLAGGRYICTEAPFGGTNWLAYVGMAVLGVSIILIFVILWRNLQSATSTANQVHSIRTQPQTTARNSNPAQKADPLMYNDPIQTPRSSILSMDSYTITSDSQFVF